MNIKILISTIFSIKDRDFSYEKHDGRFSVMSCKSHKNVVQYIYAGGTEYIPRTEFIPGMEMILKTPTGYDFERTFGIYA